MNPSGTPTPLPADHQDPSATPTTPHAGESSGIPRSSMFVNLASQVVGSGHATPQPTAHNENGEPSAKRPCNRRSVAATPASSARRSTADLTIELMNHFAGLEEDNEAFVQRAEEAEKERDDVKGKLAEKDIEIQNLKSQNDELQKDHADVEASRNAIGNSLTQVLISLDEKTSANEKEQNKVQASLNDALKKNTDLENDNKAAVKRAEEAESERNQVKEKLAENVIEIQNLRLKNGQLQKDHADVEASRNSIGNSLTQVLIFVDMKTSESEKEQDRLQTLLNDALKKNAELEEEKKTAEEASKRAIEEVEKKLKEAMELVEKQRKQLSADSVTLGGMAALLAEHNASRSLSPLQPLNLASRPSTAGLGCSSTSESPLSTPQLHVKNPMHQEDLFGLDQEMQDPAAEVVIESQAKKRRLSLATRTPLPTIPEESSSSSASMPRPRSTGPTSGGSPSTRTPVQRKKPGQRKKPAGRTPPVCPRTDSALPPTFEEGMRQDEIWMLMNAYIKIKSELYGSIGENQYLFDLLDRAPLPQLVERVCRPDKIKQDTGCTDEEAIRVWKELGAEQKMQIRAKLIKVVGVKVRRVRRTVQEVIEKLDEMEKLEKEAAAKDPNAPGPSSAP